MIYEREKVCPPCSVKIRRLDLCHMLLLPAIFFIIFFFFFPFAPRIFLSYARLPFSSSRYAC